MLKKLLSLTVVAAVFPVHAAVVEMGDLNVINDPGNASDGLRYLDMSYSVGLTEAAALANAQATYANARLATAPEFDDLFAAAGIAYNGGLTAADGFTTGDTAQISSGSNWDSGILMYQLGTTLTSPIVRTNIWTDPDGSSSNITTRDVLSIGPDFGAVVNSTGQPPGDLGWLLVSEASPVPVPAASWLFMSALLGLVSKKRLSRR